MVPRMSATGGSLEASNGGLTASTPDRGEHGAAVGDVTVGDRGPDIGD